MTQTPGRFGVEIEMNYGTGLRDREAVASALRAAGLRASANTYYTHETTPHWKVVHDGSVASGCEVVSPILDGEQGLTEMKKACAALVAFGAKVDKTTGLHIHLDATGWKVEDFRRVLKAWCANERGIDMLVAPSRRGSANRFCKSVLARLGGESLSEYDANTLINAADPLAVIKRAYERIDGARTISDLRAIFAAECSAEARYHKVNLEAFQRHGTIEFRQHQGSLNGQKIENWVRLLTGLVNKARSSRALRTQRTDRTTISATIWRLNRMSGGNSATYHALIARAKELAKAEGRKLRRKATPAVTVTPAAPAAQPRCTQLGCCNDATHIAPTTNRLYCPLHRINTDRPLVESDLCQVA